MSFKRNEEQSVISKRFVSENELEEIKRKRNEEWELAREQGRVVGESLIILTDVLCFYILFLICNI